MSTKTRSDALRKLLAETIEQSASTPAPLTITGVGASPTEPTSVDEGDTAEVPIADSGLSTSLGIGYPATPLGEIRPPDISAFTSRPAIELEERPLAAAIKTQPAEVPTPDSRLLELPSSSAEVAKAKEEQALQTPGAARKPQERLPPPIHSAKPGPAREKLSVLLESRDLAILQRFHEDARDAGIKMRRGGNPSLFVRAALRLLDDVGTRDADEWAQIVASTLREGQ